jgi:thiamine biosynthesis lipoprotein
MPKPRTGMPQPGGPHAPAPASSPSGAPRARRLLRADRPPPARSGQRALHLLSAQRAAVGAALLVMLGCVPWPVHACPSAVGTPPLTPTPTPPATPAPSPRPQPGTPAGAPTAAPAPRSVAWRARTMGTVGQVTVVTADSAATTPAAQAALRAFQHVDSLMSNWTQTSAVARLNREAAQRAVVTDPEVALVLDEALRVAAVTGGAYDVTIEPLVRLWGFLGGIPHVPPQAEIEALLPRVGYRQVSVERASATVRFASNGVQVDLGGIAKGYAVDRAVAQLSAAGVRDALVDLSGNMRPLGQPPQRDSWTVGVRDPRGRVPFFATVQLRGRSIATSGNYEQFVMQDGRRFGHVLDPRTGWPVDGLLSATVVAPTALEADAWDTGLLVLGPRAAAALAQQRPELQVVLVQPASSVSAPDTVWVKRSLVRDFHMTAEGRSLFHVRPF